MPNSEPGRRGYDSEGGAMVVSLRDHLEDKIAASHKALAAEIKHVRASVENVAAQSTREHAAVHGELTEMRAEFARELAAIRESAIPNGADRLAAVEEDVKALKTSDTARTASTTTTFKLLAAGGTATALLITVATFVLNALGLT